MPDIFISYSTNDNKIATALKQSCSRYGLDAFLAEVSILPGRQWQTNIITNLKASKYFFFLATRDSIKSNNCQIEIGAALASNRNFIPILYNLEVYELPQWISSYQVLKLGRDNNQQLVSLLSNIRQDKSNQTTLNIALAFGAAMLLLSKK